MTMIEKISELTDEQVVVYSNPSYETAFIGITEDNRAVYSYSKMIEYLVETDGCTADEAAEFIEYNTLGSSFDQGPIVVFDIIED